MVVVTARVNRRRIVTALLVLAAAAAAVFLIVRVLPRSEPASAGALPEKVKTNEQRIAYLNALGWEVSEQPIEQQEITVPEVLNGVYLEYNELQKAQGFDLSKYCGKRVTRYTYQVSNYPDGTDTVVADLLVYKNKVIGGDVQSTAMNGFMHGLSMPAAGT